ncbi:hypothetical protein C0991_002367 [Blastosporella zonata]|nr:hypothetical protein C0991_002367 [Blastosporella zonata]
MPPPPPASNSLNSPIRRVTHSNSVTGLSAGCQTDLADSDSPSPSAPSGATGAPSSLSSSNLGPPKIPASSFPSPKSVMTMHTA